MSYKFYCPGILQDVRMLFLYLILALISFNASAEKVKLSKRYIFALKGVGVEATADGVVHYLKSISPDNKGKVDNLIKLLVQGDPFDRLSARKQLLNLNVLALRAVKEAEKSDDPELRKSAGMILEKLQVYEPGWVIEASLQTMAVLKPPGSLSLILKTGVYCSNDFLKELFIKTVYSIASEEDVQLLSLQLFPTNACGHVLLVIFFVL